MRGDLWVQAARNTARGCGLTEVCGPVLAGTFEKSSVIAIRSLHSLPPLTNSPLKIQAPPCLH